MVDYLQIGDHPGMLRYQSPRSTQPGHPSVGRRNEYQRKLGSKQAHYDVVMH